MNDPINIPFLKTIQHLRVDEEVILYRNIPVITSDEEQAVSEFLLEEYRIESVNYPHVAPPFNQEAAMWGARMVYYASIFFVYRENKEKELQPFFPPYPSNIDAPAMLSADLCMRFLPIIIENIRTADPEDSILPLLNAQLLMWHFSAVGYSPVPENIDYGIFENSCLRQLYVDRIIETKSESYAQSSFFQQHIKASLGDLGSFFWKDLNS